MTKVIKEETFGNWTITFVESRTGLKSIKIQNEYDDGSLFSDCDFHLEFWDGSNGWFEYVSNITGEKHSIYSSDIAEKIGDRQ